MHKALLILALIAAVFGESQPRHGRIVGGEDTTIEEYPFMSNMQFSTTGISFRQWCGGSLITSFSVVSAAHCFYRTSLFQWRIRFGSSRASSGGTLHILSQIIIHENYDHDMLLNDIAIIRITTPAALSNAVNIINIAGPNYNLDDGVSVFSAGWGTTLPGWPFPPEQLQHVETNIINHDLCTERYAYLKTQPFFEDWPDVTSEMICAGILDIGGKDACQGDSGGPLVHFESRGAVLVGVTSWGYSCAHAVYPGVNVRVSSYTDWILTNA